MVVLIALLGGLAVLFLSTKPATSVATSPADVVRQAGPATPASPRVLYILSPKGNNVADFDSVRKALEKRGVRLEIASSSSEPIPMDARGEAQLVKVDVVLANIRSADYDAIIFGGGTVQQEYTGEKANARQVRKIIQEMLGAGKSVTAICGGPAILADAGILKGVKATCNSSVNDVLTSQGPCWSRRKRRGRRSTNRSSASKCRWTGTRPISLRAMALVRPIRSARNC